MVGGVRGGVIPNIMVVGFPTGDEGLETGPRRLSRTAERRVGYHEEDVGARVGKSRMYIRRGLDFVDDDEGSDFEGILTRESKNILTLLGGGLLREGGVSILRPDIEFGARSVKVIFGGDEMNGEGDSSSSSSSGRAREGDDGIDGDDAKCKGFRGRERELAAGI